MLWVIRRSLFSAVHAVPTATHGQTNVVIREGGACSAFASSCVKKIVKEPLPPSNSLHFRRPKKEPVVKKEPTSTSEVKKKLWWEELELHATFPHSSDPMDAPGQCMLVGRSFDKVQLMDNDTVAWWSALDNGNFIALADDEDDEQEDDNERRLLT
jgi:hypothetical protein